MTLLAVNIDHVATVREARGGVSPDPITAASIAEFAGASGIVCHLREDRRHINDRDVRMLRETVKTKLNLEMAATDEIIRIALDVLPDLVTFVPEKREELTTEGGLNVAANLHYYKSAAAVMHESDIEVSFFIEPEHGQIEAAANAGADTVEFHTGIYANSNRNAAEKELFRLREAARIAAEAGLRVTAGHGLDYFNAASVCTIPEIEEISVGHSIMARAIFHGLEIAVRDMLAAINSR
ncbi:pyridoxine 5'-phosphate synthase [Ignavibacteria bacterium]|nr:pyridoxine 5'-phosphate synthase [Bacteroidota bacterium]MCZ2133192.1 pyridoxine 5'-phosphate synthase [Bacteroidota bacterium]